MRFRVNYGCEGIGPAVLLCLEVTAVLGPGVRGFMCRVQGCSGADKRTVVGALS